MKVHAHKKVKRIEQVCYVLVFFEEAYNSFIASHADCIIGFSKFCELWLAILRYLTIYCKRLKFGVNKVWQIRHSMVDKSLANYHKVNKTSGGLIVSWLMKVWRILSIRQIRQTLATPNFRRLQYLIMYICVWSFQKVWFLSMNSRNCLPIIKGWTIKLFVIHSKFMSNECNDCKNQIHSYALKNPTDSSMAFK